MLSTPPNFFARRISNEDPTIINWVADTQQKWKDRKQKVSNLATVGKSLLHSYYLCLFHALILIKYIFSFCNSLKSPLCLLHLMKWACYIFHPSLRKKKKKNSKRQKTNLKRANQRIRLLKCR